jgi:hypothetical protein
MYMGNLHSPYWITARPNQNRKPIILNDDRATFRTGWENTWQPHDNMHHPLEHDFCNKSVNIHKLATAQTYYIYMRYMHKTDIYSPLAENWNWWSSNSSPSWGFWFWVTLSFSLQGSQSANWHFRFALVRDPKQEGGCLNLRPHHSKTPFEENIFSIVKIEQKLKRVDKLQFPQCSAIVLVLGLHCTMPNCISTVQYTTLEKVSTRTQ